MRRLVMLILAVAVLAVGMAGCGMSMSDEGGGWTAGDECQGNCDGDRFVDPEIEARAEMY